MYTTTVKNVERQIRRVEGFEVRFLYPRGTDVRSDKSEVNPYGYKHAAPDNITVAAWIRKRFKHSYQGFDADVMKANGKPARGNTKLATVRGSYED